MKLGIIGAENSHTVAIAKVINVEKKIRGFSLDYIWGETEELAKKAAKVGQIPNIVKSPKQMLDKIDAVIVDHRHPRHHLKAALPFVERGIPTFVDKPFCYRSVEGREFLKIAKKHVAPVTSFSMLPLQQSFKRFAQKLSEVGDIVAGTTYGTCDLRSKWGGVFFYGIHQVDMALKAFGYNVSKVVITKNGNGATGQLIYSDGKIVAMHLIKKNCPGFAITAVGSRRTLHREIGFDKSPYLTGIKIFTKMFINGIEPELHEHILKPIKILEAMERSIKSGQIEKVVK